MCRVGHLKLTLDPAQIRHFFACFFRGFGDFLGESEEFFGRFMEVSWKGCLVLVHSRAHVDRTHVSRRSLLCLCAQALARKFTAPFINASKREAAGAPFSLYKVVLGPP